MEKVILITTDEYETRAAVLTDGSLSQVFFSRRGLQVGSIYKGKVTAVLEGMQAAFIDIGSGKNAFLCADDAVANFKDVYLDERFSIKDLISVNGEPLVQMVKDEVAEKGARVTTLITLAGRFLVLMPSTSYVGVSRKIESPKERERLRKAALTIQPIERNVGLIVRTAAQGMKSHLLEKDFNALMSLWEKIQDYAKSQKAPALIHQELPLIYQITRDYFTAEVRTMIVDSPDKYQKIMEYVRFIAPELQGRLQLYQDSQPLFDAYGVTNQLEKALKNKVWLDSGGYIVIDKTEALTVVDVNTGKFVGERDFAKTVLKTNLEAARELARQLKLRDIGGIIIVDFIDMEKEEDQKVLLEAMRSYLQKDPGKPGVVGMTQLGLVQLVRKRLGKDLDDTLRVPCPYCGGKGRCLSPETLKIKALREIKTFSRETGSSELLVKLNPRLLVKILGWEGEEIKSLETELERLIYLQAAREFPMEKYEIEILKKRDMDKKIVYPVLDEEVSLKIEEVFPHNPQSGMAIYKDSLLEIVGGGDLAGRRVKVKIIEVTRHFAKAEIVA